MTTEKLEFNKMLVISTAHLPLHEMRAFHENKQDLPMWANYEYGVLVWCDEDNGNGWRDTYPKLAKIIDYAIKVGCQWVRLDQDADKIMDLEGVGLVMDTGLYTIASFRKGDRIQLHPATDLWMQGARYGNVTHVGSSLVSVKMDLLPRVVRVEPRNIGEIL